MTDKSKHRKSSRYRDIAAKLPKEIRLGNDPIGELLPTETELMAHHAASRQTVREALRILMDQGLIVRRAGLGSVVIATAAGAVHPQRQVARRMASISQRNLPRRRRQPRDRRGPQAGGAVEMPTGQTLVPDRGDPPLRSVRCPLGSTK